MCRTEGSSTVTVSLCRTSTSLPLLQRERFLYRCSSEGHLVGTCSSRSDRFGAGFNWENRLLWSCWSQEVMGSYLHTFPESHVMTQGHPLVTTCENILALSKDYVCTHALSMSVFRRLMSAVLPSHPLPTFRSLKTALAIGHRQL